MSGELDNIQGSKTIYMMDQKIVKPFIGSVPIDYENNN